MTTLVNYILYFFLMAASGSLSDGQQRGMAGGGDFFAFFANRHMVFHSSGDGWREFAAFFLSAAGDPGGGKPASAGADLLCGYGRGCIKGSGQRHYCGAKLRRVQIRYFQRKGRCSSWKMGAE